MKLYNPTGMGTKGCRITKRVGIMESFILRKSLIVFCLFLFKLSVIACSFKFDDGKDPTGNYKISLILRGVAIMMLMLKNLIITKYNLEINNENNNKK